MNDLINRGEAYKAVCEGCLRDTEKCQHRWDCPMLINLAKLSAADRPQGKWIWRLADNGWADHICSVCGYTKNTDIHVSLNWNYCPSCGAVMKRIGRD